MCRNHRDNTRRDFIVTTNTVDKVVSVGAVKLHRYIVRLRSKIEVIGFITVVRNEGCVIYNSNEASIEPSAVEGLTKNESALLEALSEAAGQVVAYEQLAKEVWGGAVSQNSIYRCVRNLRQKLVGTEYLIRCENERGYCLVTRNG